MVSTSKLRGHPIYWISGHWRYQDTNSRTIEEWDSRPCGHCNKHKTKDGHDACLGALPGVSNACCGHGDVLDTYIQFNGGKIINGQQAMDYLRRNI